MHGWTANNLMIRTLAGLILALLPALTASAETLTGKVVGTHDGDVLTLRVAGNQPVKVRLAGIDAPELKQPYGQKSKQALSALAFGKEAQVESPGPDKYGRTLGTVTVSAVNVNAAMVSQGMAWVYRAYPFPPELEDLEATAKAGQLGLWALPIDQRCPPWDWRHKEPCGSPIVMKVAEMPELPIVEGPCAAKRSCREMSCCDEARFFLTQCGLNGLNSDKDETPCEALCNKR